MYLNLSLYPWCRAGKKASDQIALEARIVKRALIALAHTNREIPAPLLNLGVKCERCPSLAHLHRNIKVGCGVFPRHYIINTHK